MIIFYLHHNNYRCRQLYGTMKHFYALLWLFISFHAGFAHAPCASCSALVFKENKKQWDSRILYNAEMQGGNVLLEKNAITYSLFSLDDYKRMRGGQHYQHLYNPDIDKTLRGHTYRMQFEGASANCRIQPSEKISEYFNYFLGNDPNRWASRVQGYNKVTYSQLYTGVDAVVYSADGHVKYDFVVKAGATPAVIGWRYEGVDAASLINGKIHIKTSVTDITEEAPFAFQLINGKQIEVPCNYTQQGNTFGFTFPKGYNAQYDLIIDPTLIFSTFSGSFADNFGYTATYDSKKNAYAAGSVFINQPAGGYPVTLGAYQTTWAGGSGAGTLSGTDISITKYSDNGTQRIYSTYLGGVSDELPHSLIVNGNDELFIFGTTSSTNFPVTPGAYDVTYNGGPNPGPFNGLGVHYEFGSDIIISRLSSDGTQLLASTFIGGSGMDGLNISAFLKYNYADEVRGEIDIDDQNNVYVVTCTASPDFPMAGNTFQSAYGGGALDAVIIKMNNSLSTLIWSSFIGGNDADAAYSVALDKNSNLFITGGTRSTNFPVTAGRLQTTNGGGNCDGFIAHINQNGQQIINATYYGYGSYDQAYFIETNRNDEVFVLGQAENSSVNYIKNAQYNVPNAGQFISKINYTLDTVIWSTTFGKPTNRPDVSPTAFLVDLCNKLYVAGWGGSVNGFGGTTGLVVTPDAYQSTTDNSDFYLMVMEDDASAISYGTYFGGPFSAEHVDGGTSRFDRGGVVYQSVCAGCGSNSDFPTTPGVVSNTNNSPNCNNAVFKFDFNLPIVLAGFDAPTGCIGLGVPFVNSSTASNNASYQWNFGDGTTSAQANPLHTYTQPGLYNVQLVVSDPGTCNFSDTATRQVLILANNSASQLPEITICSAQSVQIGIPPGTDTSVTYLWSPGSTLSETTVSNPFASPAQTTTYRLLIGNGICTDTLFQTVVVFTDALQLTGSNVLCPNDTLQLTVTNSQPGQQLTYQWQPSSQIISGGNTATPLVSPSANTTYIVTVVNQFGCVFTDSIAIQVTSTLPGVSAFASPDTIMVGDTTQLGVVITTDVVDVIWQADTTLSATDINNPLAYPTATRTYYVVVTDAQGCRKRDSVIVVVLRKPCEEANIYVPNAFTPNGDGRNDVFYVRGKNIFKMYVAVYDRWGQRMFETRDISRGWDGTFKGKALDPAVFGFYVEGECPGGEQFFKKGNVTLLR